jgi:hypothetical protein
VDRVARSTRPWSRARSPTAEPTARRGTDPVISDDADAIEVRIETEDGELPDGPQVDLVHPGTSPVDAAADSLNASTTASDSLRPAIHTRADWGADETLRGDPTYGEVRGAFVHHTGGSNWCPQADVPAIIGSIYIYHVTGRGWNDIGYNFLIDRFGSIWEGGYGGMDWAAVGAHVSGYNSYAPRPHRPRHDGALHLIPGRGGGS